jgi:hypothetical protein
LLTGYIMSGTNSQRAGDAKPNPPAANSVDLASLITKHDADKPSDNVHLLAADWYQSHGSAPFTLDALKEAAEGAGLTVPERLDMTLKQAAGAGKKLYASAGRGQYEPTVPGELYLKRTYGVTKGTDPVPAAKL